MEKTAGEEHCAVKEEKILTSAALSVRDTK